MGTCTSVPNVVLTVLFKGTESKLRVPQDISSAKLAQQIADMGEDVRSEELVLSTVDGDLTIKLSDSPLSDITTSLQIMAKVDEHRRLRRLARERHGKVEVTVQFVDTGETHDMLLDYATTAQMMKSQLRSVLDLPDDVQASELDIIFGGIVIDDDLSLGEVQVDQGAVLYVLRRQTFENLLPPAYRPSSSGISKGSNSTCDDDATTKNAVKNMQDPIAYLKQQYQEEERHKQQMKEQILELERQWKTKSGKAVGTKDLQQDLKFQMQDEQKHRDQITAEIAKCKANESAHGHEMKTDLEACQHQEQVHSHNMETAVLQVNGVEQAHKRDMKEELELQMKKELEHKQRMKEELLKMAS